MDPASPLELPKSWQLSQGFRQLQSFAEELAVLWHETGATQEEEIVDVQAIVSAALGPAEACLKEYHKRRGIIEARCRELQAEAEKGMALLADGSFQDDLEQACTFFPAKQLKALEKLVADIGKAIADRERQRAGIRAAAAALGIDPKDLENMSPEELAAEQARVAAKLRKEREEMLRALGLNPDDYPDDGDLANMAQQFQELKAKLNAMKENAMADAKRAKQIWEELREKPKSRDAKALALAEGSAKFEIDAAVASAVKASREAWEARRADIDAEVRHLHKLIRGHGAAEVVEPFLRSKGQLHEEHRNACREKLQQLRDELRAAEAPTRHQLNQLYRFTGSDISDLDAVLKNVEEAESAAGRRMVLAKELKRMEQYAEAISAILGQREELKALVVAGQCFERAAQAGENRWIGNSKHFLEEEKFRRRFIQQYPELRDKLLESIQVWESAEERTFAYKGEKIAERLQEFRDQAPVLASAQGDLSICGALLSILGESPEMISPKMSPKPSPGQRRGMAQLPRSKSSPNVQGPGLPPIGRNRSESMIGSPSPARRRSLQKQQSASPGWQSKANSLGAEAAAPKLPPIHRQIL